MERKMIMDSIKEIENFLGIELQKEIQHKMIVELGPNPHPHAVLLWFMKPMIKEMNDKATVKKRLASL
jgi:hypothetical protein